MSLSKKTMTTKIAFERLKESYDAQVIKRLIPYLPDTFEVYQLIQHHSPYLYATNYYPHSTLPLSEKEELNFGNLIHLLLDQMKNSNEWFAQLRQAERSYQVRQLPTREYMLLKQSSTGQGEVQVTWEQAISENPFVFTFCPDRLKTYRLARWVKQQDAYLTLGAHYYALEWLTELEKLKKKEE